MQKQRALAAGLSHGAEIRSKVSGVGSGFQTHGIRRHLLFPGCRSQPRSGKVRRFPLPTSHWVGTVGVLEKVSEGKWIGEVKAQSSREGHLTGRRDCLRCGDLGLPFPPES